MQSTPAAVIRIRMDRFDERARELGLPHDAAASEFIGVTQGNLSRLRSGETKPGEQFIAACLASGFATSFDDLFELGEAS